MRRELVFRNGVVSAVNLDENESRGIIRLLKKIEARNSGFLAAVSRVLDGGGAERLEVIGLDVNVDDEDEHMDNYDPTFTHWPERIDS